MSAVKGGFWNRILRVNLTTGKHTVVSWPESDLRKYLGCIGLGMKIMLDETRPEMKATDPDAPFVLAAGPLSGTSAPSSSNLAVVSLNLTAPYAVGTGHTHGFWAAYLKHAGWDAIVFVGKADRPVFLWVDDDKVELRDASGIWGKDTRETERLIKRDLGDEEKVSVASIGPGGEVMLPGAAVKTDRNHGAHKGSVGAIMGSKHLKAVAVRGSKTVPLADRDKFVELTTQWSDAIHVVPASGIPPMGNVMKDAGVTRLYHEMGRRHMHAGKNFSDPLWGEKYTQRFVDQAANRFTVVPTPSYNCNIACSYDCIIHDGPYQGFTASLDGGGENMEGAASMIGIEDPAEALVMTDYYDAMGLDSAVPGALIAMAFELYEKGVLTKEQTGGLELNWGSMDAAMELLNQMIEGRGFGGNVLAKGLKEAARILGPNAEACIVHIRNGGMNLHDWRGVYSIMLGEIMSSGAGVAWQGTGTEFPVPEPDLGFDVPDEPFVLKGKPETVFKTQCVKLWEDTLGTCWFAGWGLGGRVKYEADAIRYATGWDDFTPEEALQIGERMVVLQRLLALKRGFTREDEMDISQRVLEAPTAGSAKGRTIMPHLEDMVAEYYEVAGWDLTTGVPGKEALDRVGLSWPLA